MKSIATARSQCTGKHENNASYNTDYIVPDLIDFLTMIEKGPKRRLKKEIFIFVKNIVLTDNWFVVSNFGEFPKHHTEKLCSDHLHLLLKTKVKFTTFRTF